MRFCNKLKVSVDNCEIFKVHIGEIDEKLNAKIGLIFTIPNGYRIKNLKFYINFYKQFCLFDTHKNLLADSTKNFSLYCIKGLKADKNKIKYYLDNTLMLVTALAPKIGYDNAARIAKRALKNNTTLKTEVLKSGYINEKDYDKIVNPKKMIYPA